MSIAFFLTVKKEVICVSIRSTVRQIMEKMKYYNCNEIIILDENGAYVGVVSNENLVLKIKKCPGLKFEDYNKVGIDDIIETNKPVNIDYEVEELLERMADKNFVPVVDDNNIFIGIIKKNDIVKKNKYDRKEVNKLNYIV